MKTFKRKTTYNASNDRQTDRLWLTEIVKYVAKKKQIKEENIKCRLFYGSKFFVGTPAQQQQQEHYNHKKILITTRNMHIFSLCFFLLSAHCGR